MGLKRRVANIARRYPSPPVARLAKRLLVRTRYRHQISKCREGYRTYGDRYPRSILFVAGLPKSGTTWLEQMLSSFEGYHDLLIPEVAAHELRTGGSHDFELPDDIFDRWKNMLVLSKMHVHGSQQNARLLKEAGIPYLVLFRDLRDVAVSNFFYVQQSPWHLEYPHYKGLDVQKGLVMFARRTLPAYVEWVRSWHSNADPELGMILRYEEMLADTMGVMTRVAEHFGLDSSPEVIGPIVEAQSFKRLSQGRAQGQENQSSFFRKGVAGDWINHFDDDVREVFRAVLGDFLIEFGYENDHNW